MRKLVLILTIVLFKAGTSATASACSIQALLASVKTRQMDTQQRTDDLIATWIKVMGVRPDGGVVDPARLRDAGDSIWFLNRFVLLINALEKAAYSDDQPGAQDRVVFHRQLRALSPEEKRLLVAQMTKVHHEFLRPLERALQEAIMEMNRRTRGNDNFVLRAQGNPFGPSVQTGYEVPALQTPTVTSLYRFKVALWRLSGLEQALGMIDESEEIDPELWNAITSEVHVSQVLDLNRNSRRRR